MRNLLSLLLGHCCRVSFMASQALKEYQLGHIQLSNTKKKKRMSSIQGIGEQTNRTNPKTPTPPTNGVQTLDTHIPGIQVQQILF